MKLLKTKFKLNYFNMSHYEAIIKRFEGYQQEGKSSMLIYHAFPFKSTVFDKLKADGFKLSPYNGRKGIFVEISKT